MRKFLIRTFIIIAAFLLMITMGFAVFLYTFDINDHKERIQQLLFGSTGLEFKLNGPILYSLEDGLEIRLHQIELSDTTGIISKIDSMTVFMPLELPENHLIINKVILYSPIYNFRIGGINPYEVDKIKSFIDLKINGLVVENIEVVNGSFFLYGVRNEFVLDAKLLNSDNIQFSFNDFDEGLEGIVIEGLGNLGEVKVYDFIFPNLNTRVVLKNGMLSFDIDFLLDSRDQVFFSMDLIPDTIQYHIKGFLSQENFNQVKPDTLEEFDFIEGYFDAKLDLMFTIMETGPDLSSFNGDLLIVSRDAQIKGIDLNKLIKHFRRTQSFNFRDLGSVLVFGVWGPGHFQRQ